MSRAAATTNITKQTKSQKSQNETTEDGDNDDEKAAIVSYLCNFLIFCESFSSSYFAWAWIFLVEVS